MSFGGYTEHIPNVGGGFLNMLIDMGDEKKCGSTMTVVPVAIIFLLFSCYCVMFGMISLQYALLYTVVGFFFLAVIVRIEKKVLVKKL